MTEHTIDLTQLAKSRDGTGHSIFGPSGSSLYLNCAGGLIANLLHDDDAGEDAAYGTVAHSVTEIWAKEGKAAAKALIGKSQTVVNGKTKYKIEIDAEMLSYVRDCIDFVSMEPGLHMYENHVTFSNLTPIPNQGGTADCIIIQKKKMIVADWKFGKGVQVFAEQNTQLMLYAYGAFLLYGVDYDIEEIELRIAQPRLDHFDTWTISSKQLLEFAKWAKERMYAAWVPNAPRTPGVKQCQFCRAKPTCAAHLKFHEKVMTNVFEDLGEPITEEEITEMRDDLKHGALFSPKPIQELTTADMAVLLPFRGMIERWWDSLANEVLRRAESGENIPGYKMVESRSRRKFKSVNKTVQALAECGLSRADLITEQIASPAEVERILKGRGFAAKEIPDILAPLVSKPPGNPTLAPVSDKRDAIGDRHSDAFSDLADGDDFLKL